MSILIEYSKMSARDKMVLKKLQRVPLRNKFTKRTSFVSWPIDLVDDKLRVPLAFACSEFNHLVPPLVHNFNALDTSSLRPEQQEFLKNISNTQPRVQGWSVYPGFGKTITCCALIKHLNMDTVVVVHRVDLKTQWLKELESVERTRVIMLGELKNTRVTGLLVIDEVHACITKSSARIICALEPQIMIGLSATFARDDEYGPILKWLFGTPIVLNDKIKSMVKESISRKINVVIVNTGIEPSVRIGASGRTDWNHVLASLAENKTRNEMIVQFVNDRPLDNIIILVKFKSHGNLLCRAIAGSCVYFSNDSLDKIAGARIVISTIQKIGTGISIDRMNCLILATDVLKNSLQYVGRVLRIKSQDALIVDFVDVNSILAIHAACRRRVYKELGAQIQFQK